MDPHGTADSNRTMDPYETMMAEHRRIERVLDALDAFVRAMGAGTDEGRIDLRSFVDFLAGFADRHHHGKEEDLLFAAMVDHGFQREAGPIAVMLHEHRLGRGHVRTLAALSEAHTPWTAEDRRRLAEAGGAFTSLLRAHIRKEDHILYPMARSSLPPPVARALAEAFDEHDRRHGERGRALAAVGEDLARRFGAR